MNDREKVIKGLECAIGIRGVKNCDDCPYDNDFNCLGCDIVMRDALKLVKEQREVIDALCKVGYPHDFQREEPWIVNYMNSITEVVRKAVRLRNAEVKRDAETSS